MKKLIKRVSTEVKTIPFAIKNNQMTGSQALIIGAVIVLTVVILLNHFDPALSNKY